MVGLFECDDRRPTSAQLKTSISIGRYLRPYAFPFPVMGNRRLKDPKWLIIDTYRPIYLGQISPNSRKSIVKLCIFILVRGKLHLGIGYIRVGI